MKAKNIIGKKFGLLTVLKLVGTNKNKKKVYKCECLCGNIKEIVGASLLKGLTNSCGCIRKRKMTKHNLSSNRIYKIACGIISRCRGNGKERNKNYSDKGIKNKLGNNAYEVYLKISSLEGYFDTATIDRIDNSGDYEEGNLRWVSMEIQNNNNSGNRTIESYTEKSSQRSDFKRFCERKGLLFENFIEKYSGEKSGKTKKYFYIEVVEQEKENPRVEIEIDEIGVE